MKRNKDRGGNETIRGAQQVLRSRLPEGWRIECQERLGAMDDRSVDARIRVRGPDGRSACLDVYSEASAATPRRALAPHVPAGPALGQPGRSGAISQPRGSRAPAGSGPGIHRPHRQRPDRAQPSGAVHRSERRRRKSRPAAPPIALSSWKQGGSHRPRAGRPQRTSRCARARRTHRRQPRLRLADSGAARRAGSGRAKRGADISSASIGLVSWNVGLKTLLCPHAASKRSAWTPGASVH